MHYFVSFLVFNYFDEDERVSCFALIVCLMSCDCKCFVALPHGAIVWSAVCDSGMS